MPLWSQNLLVLIGVGASATYLLRGVFRALQGRKSRIGGCGVCTGCATPPSPEKKPQSERIVFVPMEALARATRNRPVHKP